jgi:UDP-N-acetylmuramate dehydrogenase
MEIKQNYNLKTLNTFGINVDAKYFCTVASMEDLLETRDWIKKNNIPYLILGGGSNILFQGYFDGIVIKNEIKGKNIISENDQHIIVKAGAGKNWDSFVEYCVNRGYAGLENLSLIPGNVGASPIQNIGAYGVEIRDFFEELEFFNIKTGETLVYGEADCRFGYRDSIFKSTIKGVGVITSVTFRLNKVPIFKTGYGTVREELDRMEVQNLTIADIRKAIINIRRSKLPDPEITGNAGSFFKNPSVSAEKYAELISNFPGLVSFVQHDKTYKLAAGWLIDQCGWKGYREGDAGVHEKQALVLVNMGKASGKDILRLSEKIQKSVWDRFGVELEREVNVI